MNIGPGGERDFEFDAPAEFETLFNETFGPKSKYALEALLEWSKRESGKFEGQAVLEIPNQNLDGISVFFVISPGEERFQVISGRLTEDGELYSDSAAFLKSGDFNNFAVGREDGVEHVTFYSMDRSKALRIRETGSFQFYDSLPSKIGGRGRRG